MSNDQFKVQLAIYDVLDPIYVHQIEKQTNNSSLFKSFFKLSYRKKSKKYHIFFKIFSKRFVQNSCN